MIRFGFRLLLCLFSFILCTSFLIAQSTYLPSGHQWHHFVERIEIKSGGVSPHFHAVLKPLERKAMIDFLQEADTSVRRLSFTDREIIAQIKLSNAEWVKEETPRSQSPVLRHFYQTPADLYHYHDEDLFLAINPVLHLGLGMENENDLWLYQNTRGLEARGMINQKLGFYTYLADNQARFPSYVNSKIHSQQGAIPGEGWNIPFGEQGWDYFTARGYIAFQATRNIGLQFGQDRNFTGYGKRSLVLSDFSNNYLFLKVNTRIGRFHYQNMFARLVDFPLRTFGGRMFDAKYMASHTLSVNLSSRFQLGFFENVVFGRSDTNSQRGLDPHYLNPVIFYRAVEHHIGDPDKVAIGLNWRWIAGHRTAFYGQVYVDDFHIGDLRNDLDSMLVYMGLRSERKYEDYASFRNKFAFQAGMQWVDVLGIDNLDMRLEGNWVRPFTYSHFDVDGSGLRPAASYTHYSQTLGHPLGANFRELVLENRYQPHPNWQLKTILFSARQGVDSAGINMGSDITRDYVSRQGDYGHTFLQGRQRTLLLAQAGVSWQWRPNVWIDMEYIVRTDRIAFAPESESRSHIFQLGLRVNALRRNHWF